MIKIQTQHIIQLNRKERMNESSQATNSLNCVKIERENAPYGQNTVREMIITKVKK